VLLDSEDASPLDLSVVLSEPIHLRPVAERDAAMREFVATFETDEETGEPYRPDTLPVIYDPEGDEDCSA
jgi:hypothetical protein